MNKKQVELLKKLGSNLEEIRKEIQIDKGFKKCWDSLEIFEDIEELEGIIKDNIIPDGWDYITDEGKKIVAGCKRIAHSNNYNCSKCGALITAGTFRDENGQYLDSYDEGCPFCKGV